MLRFVVALLSLCLLSACGGEQGSASDPANFPQRPLKVIIPFGPGGLADVTVRLAADA
ncbi:MAG TPA: tripartite tricarboxylate transporter substrate binding protein, partial [Pseudomonadaceae bacterium]|nr:tripartite tricarboxylate transporter substrate binding protein [Pseudomonadaceae bacterium]